MSNVGLLMDVFDRMLNWIEVPEYQRKAEGGVICTITHNAISCNGWVIHMF